ncbi:MAG: hypothetical protein ABW195_04820 [Ilumatobacteraceae bacterium]
MAGLQTEFPFTLPKGYVDGDGVLHRVGTMRLATARDEIEPLRDQRIDGPDDPYLTILVIARVLSSLGTLRQVTPHEVEGLFAADLAFLQDLYGIINFGDPADVEVLQRAVLPEPAESAAAGSAVSEPAASGQAVGEQYTNGGPGPSAEYPSFEPSRATRARGQIEEVPSSSER